MPIIVFVGFILGFLIKKYIPEEKYIQKYFPFVEKILLILLTLTIIIITFENTVWFYLFMITGLILGIFFREKYLYFGLSLLTFDFYIAILTFLFGLFYGNKRFLFSLIFFFTPFLLLFFNISHVSLVVLSAGALMPSLFNKQ
jgi:hypothetical protein